MSAIGPAQDAALLAALHATAFERPWSEVEFAKLLTNPAVYALVLRDTDVPLGCALAWAAAGDSELLTIAVKPEARSKGRGAALVEAVEAYARLRGAHALVLDVADDNVPGRALYAKLGFVEVGRRKEYYLTPAGRVDALTLRRTF
jgi:ribosomal-protein-alanine N-acetyltransferase